MKVVLANQHQGDIRYEMLRGIRPVETGGGTAPPGGSHPQIFATRDNILSVINCERFSHF